MNVEKFKQLLKEKGITRGKFVLATTQHSICAGYFEGLCCTGNNRAFINLAGTRKLNQGRRGDWYDHIYSVDVSRIRRIEAKKLR